MFEELKRKFAHYIIKRKFLHKSESPIAFNTALKNAKEVFVIMPGNNSDFTESLTIVKYLKIHKKEISLFISELKHNEVPNHLDCKLVLFTPSQINRFFLPDKTLLTRLRGKKFDAVIDLNRNEDTFFSCVANVVHSEIKVGFRRNRSEDYYNLLFESKQNEPLAAYTKFLEHLSMF